MPCTMAILSALSFGSNPREHPRPSRRRAMILGDTSHALFLLTTHRAKWRRLRRLETMMMMTAAQRIVTSFLQR